ncbi:glutamine--fructose-6-phosphate aminotransferase [Vulcanisaeta souniana JCM 11219]|uniref:Glutamine--fructose-6-phosphate aminotransferase [isomerizing] n=1 Tax=Vulcanisaeta souniana JCM 11219 TaxID=1293586 RepID=A0A830EGM9_9CREN|nr:glutamine--fructose-6-phosphate aminotransferase [Vulcanisaeta souniana JCM 11219]
MPNNLREPIGKVVRRCLERLEYRGYDSVGIAVIKNNYIEVRKGKGKISEVNSRLNFDGVDGTTAMGHTRWATHGKPSDDNSHPHTDCSGTVAVIHNGIISNFLELKEELIKKGHVFKSETDTEIVAHLIEEYLKLGYRPFDAFKAALSKLRGAYAFVVAIAQEPNRLYFARNTSPLVIGIGNGTNFVASDIPAFLEYTNTVIVLRDGEYGYIEPGKVYIERNGVPINIEERIRLISWTPEMASKEGYPHFMLKEIHEQPLAINSTLAGIEEGAFNKVVNAILDSRKILIIGAGTSYHAGLVGDYLLTSMLGLDTHTLISSEYRKYLNAVNDGDTVIAISQSGETIDTLVAVRAFKERGAKIIAISNVIDSAIPRESNYVLYTRAGPEIGVAATKTFTTQLTVLTILALKIGVATGKLTTNEYRSAMDMIGKIPGLLQNVITKTEGKVKALSEHMSKKQSAYYLGRGIGVPLSMEGALKLKEIAYIHAEAYPAGESKHGPIALVEENYPVVFSILDDDNADAMLGNVMEMKARDAYIIGLVPDKYVGKFRELLNVTLEMPSIDYRVAPVIYIVPMQLLAYYTAVARGYDPDKPRNLAKTVTVE